VQLLKIHTDLGNRKAVSELVVDLVGERIIPCPAGMLAVPSRPHESVEWDPPHIPAGELRVVVDRKVQLSASFTVLPQLKFYVPGCASSRIGVVFMCRVCGLRHARHRIHGLYSPAVEVVTRLRRRISQGCSIEC
jgi:hypothetical protein